MLKKSLQGPENFPDQGRDFFLFVSTIRARVFLIRREKEPSAITQYDTRRRTLRGAERGNGGSGGKAL